MPFRAAKTDKLFFKETFVRQFKFDFETNVFATYTLIFKPRDQFRYFTKNINDLNCGSEAIDLASEDSRKKRRKQRRIIYLSNFAPDDQMKSNFK